MEMHPRPPLITEITGEKRFWLFSTTRITECHYELTYHREKEEQMRKYSGIPEMVEEYMAESASTERWVTVQELRNHFGLTRNQCTTVSGFLRRLQQGAFVGFPYIVQKIEKVPSGTQKNIRKCRYLLKLRENKTAPNRLARLPEADHELCTDHDAVEIFNRVLRIRWERT